MGHKKFTYKHLDELKIYLWILIELRKINWLRKADYWIYRSKMWKKLYLC